MHIPASANVRSSHALGAGMNVRTPPFRAPGPAHAAPGRTGADEEAVLRLLVSGSPADVLARIVPEDALGLRARLDALLARRALLVDAESLLLRAQALCALHASSWRGSPTLDAWLEERAVEAVDGVLAEEPLPARPAPGGALEAFASPLGLDARALAGACARFNRLPLECREAFFALVLEGQGPDRIARERGVSLSELGRRARAALELFRAERAAAG